MTRQAGGGGGEMKGRLEAGKRGTGGGSAGGRCRNQLTAKENICL